MRETPDIATSSDDYASRFRGAAGALFLARQEESIRTVLGAWRPRSVLEVGGGHAQLAGLLSGEGALLVEHGSDRSCHEAFRRRRPGVDARFVTGDVTRLPFADRSFDMVVAVRLISHIERWPSMLEEFCRVARRAVVLDFASTRSLNALTPLIFGLKKKLEGNTRNYRSFAAADLRREFERHGFVVERLCPQLFLPMVVHRVLRGSVLLRAAEGLFRLTGMTRLLGSPVILRADRRGEMA